MNKGKIITRLLIILPVLIYVIWLTVVPKIFAQGAGYNSSGLSFGGADAQTTAAPPVTGSSLTFLNGKIVGVPPLTSGCPQGQVANGLINGVPSCISNGQFPIISFANLAGLGPSPTPASYWCMDCKVGTFQCAGGGNGNVALPQSTVTTTATSTATSTATATGTPIPTSTATTAAVTNGIQWTCPNFAATAIASPSPTATPGLSLALISTQSEGPQGFSAAMVISPSGGSGSYTYVGSWGDGSPTATVGPTPSRIYATPGVYTMNVTVTDSNSATAKIAKTVLVTGPTYYVNKLGSDSYNGTFPAHTTGNNGPFLTLGKCQTAMQSGLKVCTINDSGVYTLGQNLNLTGADANEVWTAGFGQSPTINGNGLYSITATSATNLTFYGITFTNMNAGSGGVAGDFGFAAGYTLRWNTFSVTACTTNCLTMHSDTGGLVDSNTFLSTGQTINNNVYYAGLNAFSATSTTTFSHNLCSYSTAGGCEIFTNGPSDGAMTGNVISYNLAINNTTGCVDCGAYYLRDVSATGSGANNNQFLNNTALGFGAPSRGNKGIYIDDTASGVTITGNIIAQNMGSGNLPNYDLVYHGGQNIHANNNIFQVSNTAAYTQYFNVTYAGTLEFLYQTNSSTTMTGNQSQNNIVFTNGAWPVSGLNDSLGSAGVSGPVFNQNDYWSATGASPIPFGTYTDSSSIVTSNPGFANAAQNNFTLSNPPVGWTTIPGTQGPLNSPFVAAGSTF